MPTSCVSLSPGSAWPTSPVADPAVTDDPLIFPEVEAHFGPDGPVCAARQWLHLVVVAGDYRAAWALRDANHRLCRA